MRGTAGRWFRRALLIALPCVVLGALAVSPAAAAAGETPAARATTWSFTLPRQATTSAGIYDLRGRLLRTLWRAEALPAGVHRQAWDGRDDLGQPVADAEVEFRLIHHRISHIWEGVIGNSSTGSGDSSVHKAMFTPSSFQGVGDRMFYAVGYNEWQPGLHGFKLAAPQTNLRPATDSNDAFVSHAMLASDGVRLYWANIGGVSKNTFVAAYELASFRRTEFSAGQPICLNKFPNSSNCYPGQYYKSVINLKTDTEEMPTGLAVQRQGRILAVAHGGKNLIRLLDKQTGALIREMSVPLVPKALNQLAMSPAGDLWVISGAKVLRYTDLSGTPRLAATLSDLDKPLAIATAESGVEDIWVADGRASQQVLRLDRDGKQLAAIGVKGGYDGDPRVAADRLCFREAEGKEQTAIGVASDGSVWVVDRCHNRMLRFPAGASSSARSDAQIAYLPAVYTATVDHGNPQRVFANFLEFEVERHAPLVAGKSWKLVRNWLIGMPASLRDDRAVNGGFGGFTSVETLANGRTYGLLSSQSRQVIVELPASGPLRVIKTLAQPMPGATAKVMYDNGDLGYSLSGPNTQTVLRQPIKGFDTSGDPVWSVEPVRLASVPKLEGSPHYRNAFSGMPPRFPITESGHVVFFDQSVVGNEGFHLGAAKAGSDQWLWQASPSGALDGKGSFQTKQIDKSLQYGGNAVWASGRHIIYGFHGEFYKDMKTGGVGQANQFMHFDESGLFIGQFGQPSTRPAPPDMAGLSGNAFSPTLVRDGPRLYLYHNDESTHGGVHRWRIDGWDDIGEVRERVSVGQTAGKATSMALAPLPR
jgi:hypothetical protein